MNQEIVLGMVLSAMPVGEYDKRLVILTREHGKIAAFARGARKPNCPLLSCSQPFSFGEFSIYRGKSSYTVLSGDIRNYFGELREDLEGASYGFYFCEFADYLTRENIDGMDILKLLYQSLRCLGKKTIPYRLVRAVFELRMVALNGEAPQMSACAICGAKGEAMAFSSREGGLVCKECERKRGCPRDRKLLSPAAAYALEYIIAAPIEKLYTFTVTEQVLEELESCIKEYLGIYVGHPFKSLEFLEIFC